MFVLASRNPRLFGNAVIVREYTPTDQTLLDYLAGRKMWLVESDDGHRTLYTDREIDELYIRGAALDYATWKLERSNRLQDNSMNDLLAG